MLRRMRGVRNQRFGHREVAWLRAICSFEHMVDRVHALITRLSPEPICDTSVATRLSLASTQAANIKMREAVGMGGFERRRDICSLCYNERLVTRRV